MIVTFIILTIKLDLYKIKFVIFEGIRTIKKNLRKYIAYEEFLLAIFFLLIYSK